MKGGGWWLVILGVLLMTAGTGAAVVVYNKKRRGLRNNNPGNLVITDIPWKGKVPHAQNTDGQFEQFRDTDGIPGYVWGLRAMHQDIRGDIEKKGQNTIRKLISSYAPVLGTLNKTGKLQVENDTASYIKVVSGALAKSADAVIAKNEYLPLMKSIIKHENIDQPYPDAVILQAMTLA